MAEFRRKMDKMFCLLHYLIKFVYGIETLHYLHDQYAQLLPQFLLLSQPLPYKTTASSTQLDVLLKTWKVDKLKDKTVRDQMAKRKDSCSAVATRNGSDFYGEVQTS
ncbi:hypothetical protein HK099_004706 [Clydaea vesicula]|uniref:Uncharacterized protein n=1 Tax=Clydaea vesicula TaxID=447962 RepID=A0AAD5Y2Y8_9FUNG|nr:hypothetical protein HK099_004706 [Clydaea vesicula]